MGKTYKTQGVILKGLNFGEADKILTIYTKHYGKIKAMAKGVRRVTSKKGGNVEIFNLATLFLVKGKNLDLLTETEVVDSFKAWRKDLAKVGIAFYFCELVDKLTREGQSNQTVFNLLTKGLKEIEKGIGLKMVRTFEEALIEELGFGVPESLKNTPHSLKDYLEEVTERKINSPKVMRDLGV